MLLLSLLTRKPLSIVVAVWQPLDTAEESKTLTKRMDYLHERYSRQSAKWRML